MLKLVSEWQLFLFFVAMILFYLTERNEEILITSCVAILIHLCIKQRKLHTYLRSFPFQYLGKISYSLYLTHWCVGTKLITLISYMLGPNINAIPPFILLLMGTVPSLMLAHLFYRYIEQPCLNWSRRINPTRVYFRPLS
jgi:peptidoglycan/LPS O-acetylase OafA/YrhL